MIKPRRTDILDGDEVLYLGKPNNFSSRSSDYGLLKDGEAYVVHFATPSEVSIVGVPGLHDKKLFERL